MAGTDKNGAADLLSRAFEAQRREHRRKKRKPRVLALEYFVAGLPPLQFFEHKLDELDGILGKQLSGHATLDALSYRLWLKTGAWSNVYHRLYKALCISFIYIAKNRFRFCFALGE
jgi:hypothetical protein